MNVIGVKTNLKESFIWKIIYVHTQGRNHFLALYVTSLFLQKTTFQHIIRHIARKALKTAKHATSLFIAFNILKCTQEYTQMKSL